MGETADLLKQIRGAVGEARNAGHKAIDAAALDAYLVELEETVDQTKAERDHQYQLQLEHFKSTNTSNLAGYAAEVQVFVELMKSALGYGQEALKSAMLINGGAAVAVLGFLSNAATKNAPMGMLVNLPIALLFFAGGALAAAIAVGLSYLSQGFFAMKRERPGKGVRLVVFVLVIGAYTAFALGAIQAYMAFR